MRQPEAPNREVLAGLVERVTFHNADNGFCVLRIKARGHRDLVTVVGHAAMVSAGEWITASGEWINDRTHGQQFKARMWTPPAVQEGIRTTRDMLSGTVVCPASQVRHACAAGPYGVRGSDPNRSSGMLDSPARRVGFSDPVSLTFCPYVVFRPNRTVRDHPRITASNRHPRSPVFQFRTAHFSSKQLFPSSGSRHRCPVTFLLDRQRPDDARHLVRQCDGD